MFISLNSDTVEGMTVVITLDFTEEYTETEETKWPNQGLNQMVVFGACTWTQEFFLQVQDTSCWKPTDLPFSEKLVPEKVLGSQLGVNLLTSQF